MAPFSLMTASISCLAKSLSALSCTSSLARCTSFLPAVYFNPVKCLSSQTSGPPKKPLNGYMRYFVQQHPILARQNTEMNRLDITRKIAQQWRMLRPEEKLPFEDAAVKARAQFKVDLQRYRALLTPAQIQQQALEKKQMMAKRKSIRKKRELTSLGRPKRPRTGFNIYMAEHFEEARGITIQAKMKSLYDDWKNLFNHQKQVYTQLAQDDKIRYKNEMKSWENHMIEIGREDLIREQTLSTRIKQVAKSAKKVIKKVKAKAKPVKKTTATGKSTTTKTSTATKTARSTKKT